MSNNFTITSRIFEEWEEVDQLYKQIRATRDELRRQLIAELQRNHNGVAWNGATRMRVKDSTGRSFSIVTLREKYGNEWLEENRERLIEAYDEEWLETNSGALIDEHGERWIENNSSRSHSATLEVKVMTRRR